MKLLSRLTFLQRFTLLTFGLAVATAVILAYVLYQGHIRAIEQDEATRAIGQVEARITTQLEKVLAHPSDQKALDELGATISTDAQQYISGVRIYAADGRAIYPGNAPPDGANVLQTLQRSEPWGLGRKDQRLGEVRSEYAPFAGTGGTAVVVVDLALAQMVAVTTDERKLVILVTLGVVGLIFFSLFALAAGASRELERRRIQAEGTFAKTLGLLAETMELRDPYTAGHSRRVATYSRRCAAGLGLSARECDIIENAALLHDLGKIGIPDSVLLKAGKLDDAEYDVIKQHPRMGANIIASIASMEDVVPCVMHHHERFDGTGYPDKLLGGSIPFGARIIAVADSFDAMTTTRPYRRGLPLEAALDELKRVAGRQLDATVVERFIDLVLRAEIVLHEIPAETIFGSRLASELQAAG